MLWPIGQNLLFLLHFVEQEYVSPRMDGFHVGFPYQCPQVGTSLAPGVYSRGHLGHI